MNALEELQKRVEAVEPTLVKTWEELQLFAFTSKTHILEIDLEFCNGWIVPRGGVEVVYGTNEHYLSTHSFYGLAHEESTRILQACGFNVRLANWDAERAPAEEECARSHLGCFECYEKVEAPDWSSRRTLCMDKCMVEEVQYLWSLGIRTTGCCCGRHSDSTAGGYIGVYPEYIEVMEDLGYEVRHNECRPGDRDSFIPKMVGRKERK